MRNGKKQINKNTKISEMKAVVIAHESAIETLLELKRIKKPITESSSFRAQGSRSDRGGHVTYNLTGP